MTTEWILVIVATVTAAFICWQAWETRRAANAAARSVEAMHQQTGLLAESISVARTSANAAKKSAEIAELSLKVADRADVLLKSAGLVTDTPGSETAHPLNPYARVVLVFKNFGRTRAEDVKYKIELLIPGVPTGATPIEGSFVLGPDATQRAAFETFNSTLTRETFSAIVAGKILLRFSGTVIYRDIFGDSHSFECKGLLDAQTGMFRVGETDPREKSEN